MPFFFSRPTLKIAIVGCGAVGSYYGAKLARDGHDVHFLLRGDYEVVRASGVRVMSDGESFTVRPRCAREPGEIGVCDLVLIALKTTANSEFSRLLPPLVAAHTAVMTLQNGLGNEAALARVVPAAKVLGGLCFVCLNRIQPGVIQHIAHGKVVIGEFQRGPEPRTHDLCTSFKHAGIPSKVAENLERAHWEKLIWNIPFNGLGVAGTAGYEAWGGPPDTGASRHSVVLTTDILLGDPRWERIVRALMAEVIATANALGHPIPESHADRNIANTRTMGAYRASTLIDFECGRPLELQSLFLEPLRRARAAAVATPVLERLCDTLLALDARRATA